MLKCCRLKSFFFVSIIILLLFFEFSRCKLFSFSLSLFCHYLIQLLFLYFSPKSKVREFNTDFVVSWKSFSFTPFLLTKTYSNENFIDANNISINSFRVADFCVLALTLNCPKGPLFWRWRTSSSTLWDSALNVRNAINLWCWQHQAFIALPYIL